jgi:hypothetical protein
VAGKNVEIWKFIEDFDATAWFMMIDVLSWTDTPPPPLPLPRTLNNYISSKKKIKTFKPHEVSHQKW